jgi:hypothetical protein
MNVVAEGGGGYREVTIIEHATCLSRQWRLSEITGLTTIIKWKVYYLALV